MVGLFSVFIFTKIKIENGPENMFSLLFENIFIKNAFRMRPTFEKIKKVVFYISVFMLTKKKFSVFKICKWKCPKCTLVRYRCLSFCPFRCGTYVLTNRTASPIHVPLSLSLSLLESESLSPSPFLLQWTPPPPAHHSCCHEMCICEKLLTIGMLPPIHTITHVLHFRFAPFSLQKLHLFLFSFILSEPFFFSFFVFSWGRRRPPPTPKGSHLIEMKLTN